MTDSFTVCYLFSHDGRSVLLARKKKTVYKGRLNGVGGRVEICETPDAGAVREIAEETGIELDASRLLKLGETILPENCAGNGGCDLHFYAVKLTEQETMAVRTETDTGEPLVWRDADYVRHANPLDQNLAGDGDLPYWVNAAMTALGFGFPENNGRTVSIIVGSDFNETVACCNIRECDAGKLAAICREQAGPGSYVKIVPETDGRVAPAI